MAGLSTPTVALATKLLEEVGFDDRLIGYRLRERMGAVSATLYSFAEVVALLHDSCPRIDFARLEAWVRDVQGDRELADRMKECLADASHEREKLLRLRTWMDERLAQARALRELGSRVT
ncbi:MAG: hypothetical protein HY900_18040 [Deltaproteobacteria bacterium]|nr:hypothetical protein [Deltaproteobacteria bacterium]